jgi:hypothetical protein
MTDHRPTIIHHPKKIAVPNNSYGTAIFANRTAL